MRLDTVVLDCPDPAALARFYAALLGRQVDPGGDATWQSLTEDGSGLTLAFQRAERYVAPSWPDGVPQQLHLDLTVTDMAAAHARAVQLGAVPWTRRTPRRATRAGASGSTPIRPATPSVSVADRWHGCSVARAPATKRSGGVVQPGRHQLADPRERRQDQASPGRLP